MNVSLDDSMVEACGIVASTSSSEEGVLLMIDSGSDAHMCTPLLAPRAPLQATSLRLRDVQLNSIPVAGGGVKRLPS